jgi:hypothetical protein
VLFFSSPISFFGHLFSVFQLMNKYDSSSVFHAPALDKMKFSHFLQSEKPLTCYFTFAVLVFLVSFLFAPSNKAGNNVYYAIVALPAVPALALLFYRRANLTLCRPEIFLWGGLVVWMILQGWIVNDLPMQYLKHIFYAVLFLLVVGRLISPHFFRSPAFARGQFWALQLYFLFSILFFWIFGDYSPGSLVGDYSPGSRQLLMLARIGGQGGAIWLAAALVLALPVWSREKRWVELASAVLFSGIFLIFVMQTRSALVGLFGALLLGYGAWIWRCRPHARTGLISGVAGVLVLGALLWWLSPTVQNLVSRADSYRFELWSLLWKDLQNCGIWIGCGGEFHSARLMSNGGFINHAHGLYQSFALQTGLISLLVFLSICFWTLRTAWKNQDAWGIYLLAGLIAQCFDGGQLMGNPDDYWPVILFSMALIMNPCLPPVQANTAQDDR